MKSLDIFNLMEFISLSFIISYFFFNNIFYVFTGILLSIILLKKKKINEILIFMKQYSIIEKGNIKLHNSSKDGENDIKITKNYPEITLVEEVEELGFIPSLDKTKK